MKAKNFILPGVTGLLIVLSMFLTIIVKGGTEFKPALILAYAGFGIVGFGYSALLVRFKAEPLAWIFLVFTLLSGVYFFITMPGGPEGMLQLAALLGWLMLMALSFVLTLIALAVTLILRRKAKK